MEDPVKMFEAALGEAGNPQFQGALNKLFKSSDELVGTQARVGAQAAQDQVTAQRSRAGASEQVDAIEKRLQEIQDLRDPGKYQEVRNSDGSISFYRPDGVEISAGEYSQITNKSLADVFSKSDNLYQQQFASDYKSLQELSQLWANNDTEGVKKLLGVDDENQSEEQKALYDRLQKGGTLEELHKEFIQSYNDIFGPQTITTPEGGQEARFRSPSLGDRARGFLNKIPGVNLDTNPAR